MIESKKSSSWLLKLILIYSLTFSSPLKRSKLKEESSSLSLSSNEKAKKSVLEDVKTKTTETWREFSKDVMSAGAKLKQQFEIRLVL